MTRAAKGSPAATFAELVAKDPEAAVLEVLRAVAPAALSPAEVKQRLADRLGNRAGVEGAWKAAQERIRYHDHVERADRAYRWIDTPRIVPAEDAFAGIARGGLARDRRAELVKIVRAALATPAAPAQARAAPEQVEAAPGPAATSQQQYERAERRRAARERQARIDAMSTLADLAAQVEELTAKRAASGVVLEHARAVTAGAGLELIGIAGEATPYDESRHDPVGEVPAAGAPVNVVRPGYVWHAPGGAVLISKALVTRA